MEPENGPPVEKDIHLYSPFWGSLLVFRGVKAPNISKKTDKIIRSEGKLFPQTKTGKQSFKRPQVKVSEFACLLGAQFKSWRFLQPIHGLSVEQIHCLHDMENVHPLV